MQFNVPQFTEVEDRVIGPLTVRQFVILLGAGGVTFIGYSASKNIAITVIVGVVAFIPALIFAFGQFNGRNLYRIVPVFFNYLTLPKRYVFQKESRTAGSAGKFKKSVASSQMQNIRLEEEFPVEKGDAGVKTQLQRIAYQLNQRKEQEQSLVEEVVKTVK